MYYVTAARFSKGSYDASATVRDQALSLKRHLEEVALDSGFDPSANVVFSEDSNEVRIGVSEEFDFHLREAPGGWRQ